MQAQEYSMNRHNWISLSMAALLVVGLLAPLSALAASADYTMVSGEARITPVIDGRPANYSVNIALGSGGATYDNIAGTLSNLEFAAAGPIYLDGGSIDEAQWASVGSAATSSTGQFAIDTVFSGGFSAGFGEYAIVADSETIGSVHERDGYTELRIAGLNLAQFQLGELVTLTGVKVHVAMDLERVTAAVPEPGAAMLFGFGIIAVGSASKRRLDR